MRRVIVLAAFLLAAWLTATRALADPCAAPLPTRAGATLSGRVEWNGDGDGRCVRTAAGLVEVRLADFNAPEKGEHGWREARGALRDLAMNRWAVCTVRAGRYGRTNTYDRVLAVCRVGGRRLGDAMRAKGVTEGGR